jgi:hypothetical protein
VISRRLWPLLLLTAALLAVAALLAACGSSGAPTTTTRFNPTLTAAVSNAATSANADITFAVALPAGNDILGTFGLSPPGNSWSLAGGTAILNDSVTAVGTMAVIFKPDGNCTGGVAGIPRVYPFSLLAKTATAPALAEWDGIITDFGDTDPKTNWTLNLTVSPGQAAGGFAVDAVTTDAVLPAGSTVCTPQTFTITFCGRANPSSTATACGAGAAVVTNPSTADPYTWTTSLLSEAEDSAEPSASVCIGPSCATPTPSGVATSTPTP